MSKTTITFDASNVKIEPRGSWIAIEVETTYPTEVLDDLDDKDIQEYWENNLASKMSDSDFLSRVSASDAISYYGIDEILSYIPDDVLIKHLRENQ
jgi:hypothetical protein